MIIDQYYTKSNHVKDDCIPQLYNTLEEAVDTWYHGTEAPELYDIYLVKVNVRADDVEFALTLDTIEEMKRWGVLIDFTESILDEENRVKLFAKNKSYSCFTGINSKEDLTKAIKSNFVSSLRIIGTSELFANIIYDKTMADVPYASISQFKYRNKLKYISDYATALHSNLLSKDMQVYLLLTEIDHTKGRTE